MWDLPGPGIEHVFPALGGGFSTTAPPGKPQMMWILIETKIPLWVVIIVIADIFWASSWPKYLKWLCSFNPTIAPADSTTIIPILLRKTMGPERLISWGDSCKRGQSQALNPGCLTQGLYSWQTLVFWVLAAMAQVLVWAQPICTAMGHVVSLFSFMVPTCPLLEPCQSFHSCSLPWHHSA